MRLEPMPGIQAVDDAATLISLHCRMDTEPPRIIVSGEVDADNAGHLERAVTDLVRRHRPERIELDLRKVTFLDSSGIRVLVQCHAEAQQADCDIVLAGTSAAVYRVLDITGLVEHFGL